jgi:hypothetical protein
MAEDPVIAPGGPGSPHIDGVTEQDRRLPYRTGPEKKTKMSDVTRWITVGGKRVPIANGAAASKLKRRKAGRVEAFNIAMDAKEKYETLHAAHPQYQCNEECVRAHNVMEAAYDDYYMMEGGIDQAEAETTGHPYKPKHSLGDVRDVRGGARPAPKHQ